MKKTTSKALSLLLALILVLSLLPAGAMAAEDTSVTPYVNSPTDASTQNPDHTPKLTYTQADGKDIPTDGYTYNTGDAATPIKVICTSDVTGGTYAYCWYTREKYGCSRAAGIYNQAEYTPATARGGEYKYYCKVEFTYEGITYTVNGDYTDPALVVTPVKVLATSAAKPSITKQPLSREYVLGEAPLSLELTAQRSTDGGKLSYQWFSSADNTTFSKIEGATAKSYTPAGSDKSTSSYYYCEVTNTVKSLNGKTYTASENSDTATISFKSLDELGANWQGKGTAAEPYRINNITELEHLRDMVNTKAVTFESYYFILENDITLPSEWVPIGALKNGANNSGGGANINPFSGVFDGGGKTITTANEGLPLFGYVREARICNLNISGKIAGYGLVNNYCVDYGADGNYSSGTGGSSEPGCPDTVDIDNVTLRSGSSTRCSGFIGGFASAANVVNISNSKIEANVVIGYDKSLNEIGSFAGNLNGTMTNCVSYATVYGKDYVGGLVGRKGEAIGPCKLANSSFQGKLEASGSYVGGIIGAGYYSSSAPNAPCISVRNCYVTGSVLGADFVGGIIGAEPAVKQCLANGVGYIQNNYFAGTLNATAQSPNVGGIIGHMRSLNRYNVISNNYYTENCGAKLGIGSLGSVDISDSRFCCFDDPTGAGAEKLAASATAAEFTDGTILNKLNAGVNSGKNWISAADGSKFPELGSKLCMVDFTVNASKSAYPGGSSLDVGGMTILARFSDGTTKAIDGNEVVFSGFNSLVKGYKTITAAYQNHTALFEVNVTTDPPTANPDTAFNVSFSLLGDSKHGEGGGIHTFKSGGLSTWLAPKVFTVSEGSTALDVLETALNEAGMSWSNKGGYISGITRSGVTLSEFDNGPNSGWMFLLNGNHPLLSVSEQLLKSGDTIIFHYTDDYNKEQGSEIWGGNDATPENSDATVMKPETTVTDGAASSTISSNEADKAVEAVKKSGEKELVIAPQVNGDVSKMTVSLPKTAVSNLADGTKAALTVDSKVAKISLSTAALSTISKQSGDNVSITAEKADTSKMSEENKKLVGNHPVYDFSVKVCENKVTEFGGTVTVSIPYTPQEGEDTDKITIYYIDKVGNPVEMTGAKYDPATKSIVFETTHFSTFAVVYDEARTLFRDVHKNDWFCEAVQFVTEKNLFNGTSATSFSPNTDMSRAMLVTVLHRLAGKPAPTKPASFSDVAAGEWYADAVAWAAENKIVSGNGNGFDPNGSITREALAAVLYRYAIFKGLDVGKTNDLARFNDAAKVSDWAQSAMKWSVGTGLIAGRTATALAPCGNAVRAEVAVMLRRFVTDIVR
ncbi:MAG: S-layer homology domain-containing protein [Oscillospiraceae bacterium]